MCTKFKFRAFRQTGTADTYEMGHIHSIDDANRYIERIGAGLERFSEGGPVVMMYDGSPESELGMRIMLRTLGDRAVILTEEEVTGRTAGEEMSAGERILAAYFFWKRYIAERGPVAYCFCTPEEDLREWDEAEAAAGADSGKGLFRRRFEMFRGVSREEIERILELI